ncbi:MAG: glycosyltransferase involved in cell wall biosynthesis [Limimaricola cinnabarinus]|jgi:glycosyltransferase involved in cell wall biosynthesis|uniref:glycosyltransferase n=1 Tax=Limimaricola cinnabarinus TaxID=1125964 RepID=UPI0039E5AF78
MKHAPRLKLLMTGDAVGGVWRFSLDLARALSSEGVEVSLLGFGPQPAPYARREAERYVDLHWSDLPLDWLADGPEALMAVPHRIADLADRIGAALIHLNLPSQAAGLETQIPVLAMSHSCVPSWFRAVKGSELPPDWNWLRELNARGLGRADLLVAPSQAHADLVTLCYGLQRPVEVVPNAATSIPAVTQKAPFAYAAARWWDEGKNAAALDAAAARMNWPLKAFGALKGPQGQQAHFNHAQAEGSVGHPVLRAVAARAGVFLSPSLYEPFGLAALEAASAGAALVLADIPTYRELWDEAALFADPRDPAALAAAANRLARDADLRGRLGAAALERAGDFAPARQARRMRGLYERLRSLPNHSKSETVMGAIH